MLLRCKKSGNPCGTDTWAKGVECQCENCQLYLKNKKQEDIEFKRFVKISKNKTF